MFQDLCRLFGKRHGFRLQLMQCGVLSFAEGESVGRINVFQCRKGQCQSPKRRGFVADSPGLFLVCRRRIRQDTGNVPIGTDSEGTEAVGFGFEPIDRSA